MFYHSMKITNTPLVYNGDIWSSTEADRVYRSVDAISSPGGDEHSPTKHKVPIMICRPALWNPSVFAQFRNNDSTKEDTPCAILIHDVLSCILKQSAATAHCPLNTRYLLQQILAGAKMLSSDTRAEVVKCYNLVSLSNVLHCKQFVQGEKRKQRSLWDAKCYQAALLQDDSDNAVVKRDLIKYCNSAMWPGIVCHTSHVYNDKYFDDNYYVAFSKPSSTAVKTNSTAQSKEAAGTVPTKRPFAYSGFSETSSTIVRVKKTTL